MNRLLLLKVLLPLLACGQSEKYSDKAELTKLYSQAIADFIIATRNKNIAINDTLFFGKRNNKQDDDFPDIELPESIEKTHIQLISPEAGTIKQKECTSCIYINLIGWVDINQAEFLFYVFSNGFQHQYNYSMKYIYNVEQKEYKLNKLEFQGPPFDK